MISQHTSKETHIMIIKDQEAPTTDTTLIFQLKHMPLSNSFKQMIATSGLDLSGNQKAGSLLSKQNYEETEALVGGKKQIHSIQTTLVQNTSAQRSTPLLSNHQMKKSLQEEFITLQPSKEVTHSQNKLLSFPKSKQQSTKALKSLLIPSQPLPFIPNYPSKPQWEHNRKKLMLLLDKADRKHKGSTLSLTLPMVLLKGTYHPPSPEIGAQPESL